MTPPDAGHPSISPSHAHAVNVISMKCYGTKPRIEAVSRLNNLVFRLHFPAGSKILKLPKGESALLLKELMLIDLLRRHGIPVAAVEHADPDGRVIGKPFFIMDSAGDRTVADWIGKPGDLPPRLFTEMGDVLARIHAITLPRSGDIRPEGVVPSDPREFLGKLADLADLLAREGWLKAEEAAGFRTLPIPEVEGRQLCHSDFHAVQCIVRDDRIAAVVDWESAWAGNPAIDFAIAHGYLDYYASPELIRSFAVGYTARRSLPRDYRERYLPVRMVVPLGLMRAWHGSGPRVWEQAVARRKVERAIELYRAYARRLGAGTSDGSDE